MALSGCMPKKYWVVSYAGPNGRGPDVNPSPVIVERDSIKGQVRLKPGGLKLRKHHELHLALKLQSESNEQLLGEYIITADDLVKGYVMEYEVPLNVKLTDGKGFIWLTGEKVHRKKGKSLKLEGISPATVMTEAAARAHAEKMKKNEH